MEVLKENDGSKSLCGEQTDQNNQRSSISHQMENTMTEKKEDKGYSSELLDANVKKEDCGGSNNEQIDCHRMQQLRKSLERTVERCVQSGKLSLFSNAYPALFSQKLKVLKNLHEQFQTQLRENIKCEIELMFNEERVPELMNELETLIKDQTTEENKDNQAWRASNNVEDNLRPHLIAVKLKQKEKLKDLLQDANSENKQLQEVLLKKRQNLTKTVTKCEGKVEGLVRVVEELEKDC